MLTCGLLQKNINVAMSVKSQKLSKTIPLSMNNQCCLWIIELHSYQEVPRGAARGDIFARHLAAHQRIWN